MGAPRGRSPSLCGTIVPEVAIREPARITPDDSVPWPVALLTLVHGFDAAAWLHRAGLVVGPFLLVSCFGMPGSTTRMPPEKRRAAVVQVCAELGVQLNEDDMEMDCPSTGALWPSGRWELPSAAFTVYPPLDAGCVRDRYALDLAHRTRPDAIIVQDADGPMTAREIVRALCAGGERGELLAGLIKLHEATLRERIESQNR